MRGRGAIFSISAALLAASTGCGAAVAPVTGSLVRSGKEATADRPTRPTEAGTRGSPASSAAPRQVQVATTNDAPPVWTRHVRPADADVYPQAAWVAAPVVTVWNQPGLVRPVDTPVLQPQPLVGRWLASMSFLQKVDLGNRMATQALLDDPLTVLDVDGTWAHVLVDEQTGSVYGEGIDGWVPRSQITFTPLRASASTATVSVPLAPAGNLVLSYGTRLPVVGSVPGYAVVDTAEGVLQVPQADVRTSPLPASGAAVLAEAKKFLGLPYLWAGTSAYGFDCSGLTYSIYREFGINLSRDAADQAQQGTPVAKPDLRPGDLLFFAAGGLVHHVAVYAGNGMMLDAPETGRQVELVPLWNSYLSAQYAGARRYIS